MSIPSQSVSPSHRMPVQVFEGHKHWVTCVCFYPDDNKIVSGSDDNTVRIWIRETGLVEVLSGHTRTVWEVDVSRDGKMVVSGSADTTVTIWNRESGETVHVFEGHQYTVYSVQFSTDSKRIASGSYDCTVRVWSVETGKLAFEPIKCHGNVWCVRFSPNGDRIASGANSVQIWDAETGKGPILEIRDSQVESLAWTLDGKHIIGGRQGNITIWNSRTGEQLRTWKAHSGWIRLKLSPTGTHLVTCDWDNKTAFLFDTSTGEQVAALQHDGNVSGIAYSRSGRFIAAACHDKVYLTEAPSFEDQTKLPARAQSFSSFLDRPAIPPLAESSPHNGHGIHESLDSLSKLPGTATHHAQQASPMHQRVLNKVGDIFTNLFARRPAIAAQNNDIGEVVQPVQSVQVAAGRDRTVRSNVQRRLATHLRPP
ncbi:WD40 repeat-like protein [Gyrodon lividus]|nr:WD40 repeat-like protein [Gyrodon lividus]